MDWKDAKNIKNNQYDLPWNWLKIEYFEVINILFRFENSLRTFVYIVLKNEYKEKWKDKNITSDDQENYTIAGIAKKRIEQAKNHAYLGYTFSNPLLHLTSGELGKIITSNDHWAHFKPYFLGSREIIKNKFDEIGTVRNSVAHFRPIKRGDVELIKQNSIHTLTEIEKALEELINCSDNVPTNSEDRWYQELITINSSESTLSFNQSKDEKWVNITLSFNSPILKKEIYGKDFGRITCTNLKTSNVISNYQNIHENIISVTEDEPSIFTKDIDNIKIVKRISFRFSRKCLEMMYEKIKEDFIKILTQIKEELNLIQDDNLARGKLIEVVTIFIEKNDESPYYHSTTSVFSTEFTEDTPVEFWGNLNYAHSNFISNTNKFPWMSVTVSDDKELPF